MRVFVQVRPESFVRNVVAYVSRQNIKNVQIGLDFTATIGPNASKN